MYIFVKIKAITDFTIPSVCLHRLNISLDSEIISVGVNAGLWHYKCALKLKLKCLVSTSIVKLSEYTTQPLYTFFADSQSDQVEILGSLSWNISQKNVYGMIASDFSRRISNMFIWADSRTHCVSFVVCFLATSHRFLQFVVFGVW